MQQDMWEHQYRAERIETLIQEIAAFSDPQRSIAEELVQILVGMYGEGLTRILELTMQATAPGQPLIETFANDNLLGALFLLHELHPLDIETRVEQALVEVRPYLKSHGGNVELLKVEDNIAYLRLEGSCDGCPASTITLKQSIEEAIYKAAPDLVELKVEGVTEPSPRSTAIPVTFVPPRRNKAQSQPTMQDEQNHLSSSKIR